MTRSRKRQWAQAGVAGLLPSASLAANVDGAALGIVWIVPFVGVLVSIALLPALAPDAWHRHMGKIAAGWAVAFALPYAIVHGVDAAAQALAHAALLEYVPFVVLLLALYTVAGGIGLFGDLHGSPRVNVAVLGVGAVLANLMGTTGAAMVLVRPLIRANAARRHRTHVVVFFIFIVANAGGALTPLGDPPLFLGFLKGVPFFWTTVALFWPTVTLVGALLVVFYGVDRYLYRRDRDVPRAPAGPRLRLEGRANVALLFAIAGCVLASGVWRPGIDFTVLGTSVALQDVSRDVALLGIAALSLAITPRAIHVANGFRWGPMQEVAKLFAAIFVTIVPALAILGAGDGGPAAPLLRTVFDASGQPRDAMFFWLTGLLSAFLDNAPTYLVFFDVAGGDAARLVADGRTLAAISAGAVFMGALTYVGNAPNLMVRAIAEDQGIRMPSFVGYLCWSVPVLVPLLALSALIFFR